MVIDHLPTPPSGGELSVEGLSVGSRQETESHSVNSSEEMLMKGVFIEVHISLRQPVGFGTPND